MRIAHDNDLVANSLSHLVQCSSDFLSLLDCLACEQSRNILSTAWTWINFAKYAMCGLTNLPGDQAIDTHMDIRTCVSMQKGGLWE